MLKLLLEKTLEWDLSFWMASLNFRNAFDKIEHESLFRDLREQGMPGAYITLLARLYHNQTTRWCAQSCIFQRGFGGCYVIMEANPHKSRRLTWSTRTFDKCNICWQPPFICDVFSVFHMVEILCEERANVGWQLMTTQFNYSRMPEKRSDRMPRGMSDRTL